MGLIADLSILKAIPNRVLSFGLRGVFFRRLQVEGHLTIVSNEPKGAHFLLDLPILLKVQE
jgi:hypothetical protein